MVTKVLAHWSRWFNTAISLALWEVLGQFQLVASGTLPPPSAILLRFWADRGDYPLHVLATLQSSFLGFLIGNAIAILAGTVFALSPRILRMFRGVNIAIFALPPIAISPILVLTLSGMTPRVVLAALGCYFTTMTATVMGLTQADARSIDVVRAYGGTDLSELRYVRLRGALPVILGGFRIAAPAAVLRAILAEFGGGGRYGLGAYLLGSLGRADPPRLWGIGLTATLISGLAYALFSMIGKGITGASLAVTVPTGIPVTPFKPSTVIERVVLAAVATTLPLVLWWLLLRALNVLDMIAKTPFNLFNYFFLSPNAATTQQMLRDALAQTLPLTVAGLFAGLAFALALWAEEFPAVFQAFMPVALVTQSMPLVALTPLLVLMLGRGPALTLWITISVTFFPAFVTIAQGIIMVPKAALDVPRAYGASKLQELWLVAIPSALPYVFAAMRLAAPRALLGVMIAEWLATGTGLGNLLNHARGYLDYGMIWTVAVASVLIAIIFYQIVLMLERWVLSLMGIKTIE